MITFKDLINKAFLDVLSSANISPRTIAECFFITVLLAAYLFFLYQLVTRKSFYDKAFNMSIPILAVIVCAIVLTIQYNIVVSLGMVGALSIVRFRTAVKSPIDLVFLFWAIAIGIICGASLHLIAVIMSAVITAGLFVMELLPVAKAPLLLIVNATDKHALQEILSLVAAHTRHYQVKSQSVDTGRLNMIIEIRAKDTAALLEQITDLSSVTRCSLVSHDGEVTF